MTAELDVLAGPHRTRVLRIEQFDAQAGGLLAAGGFDAVELRSGCENFRGLLPFAPGVRWLRCCEPQSLDGLESLTAVRRISFTGSQVAWKFDYRKMADLRALEADELGAVPTEFLAHPRLERLDVMGGTIRDLAPLSGSAALAALRIVGAKTRSLDGIGRLGALRELRLLEARALTDISAIAGCVELQIIEIADAVKLTDLRPLTGLPGLRLLFADARGAELPDLDWVAGMPALECLGLWAPVRSLDLARIAAHPRLYDVLLQVPAGQTLPTEEHVRAAFAGAARSLRTVHRYPKAKVPTLRLELVPATGGGPAPAMPALQQHLSRPHVALHD